MSAAATGAGSSMPSNVGSLSEDEQLALALAASMEARGDDQAAPIEVDTEGGADVPPVAPEESVPSVSPEELAKQAEEMVPAEPPQGDPIATRVAVRMPDGMRAQRRFHNTTTISTIHTFCRSKVRRPRRVSTDNDSFQPRH